MSGINGVSGQRSSPWEDTYEKPLPNQDRRSAENVANSPWLQAAPAASTYSPELFANPAMRGTPVALAPPPPPPTTRTAPAVAANAFKGIELALTAERPESTRSDTSHAFNCGAYRMVPAMMRRPDGTDAIVYWRAVNRETKREDFVVGPAALGSFTSDPKTYSEIALRVFANGEPDQVTLESMKVVDLAMKEGPGAALRQLGKAWKTALTDADWVAKRTTDMALTARATSRSPRAPAPSAAATAAEASDASSLSRTHKPTFNASRNLPAGEGRTDKYGNVEISRLGTAKDRALASAHESLHSALSPKAMNGLREFRADLRMLAYEKSSLCRYLEEALAESYAQVKVNGLQALPEGLRFPIREGYVTVSRTVGEAAIGTILYGGVVYGVYLSVSK